MSRVQALRHPLTHTPGLRPLALRPYHTLRPKSLSQPYIPIHTPRTQALLYPPDPRSPAQALVLLFPLLNLTRVPFLRLKRTQRLRPTPPSHIRHLLMASHQLNHTSRLEALFYLLTSRPPSLLRLPLLSSHTSLHQAPHSRWQRRLLPCIHMAPRMCPRTHRLFPRRLSPYRMPRKNTLRPSMPHHSPLTTSQVYRILTYRSAIRHPFLFRRVLPSHNALSHM
jgi:hypothetical protein